MLDVLVLAATLCIGVTAAVLVLIYAFRPRVGDR